MAAPTIESVYPADNDSGIPTGATLKVVFDKGIDLESAKNSVVLFGADFDVTSGPQSAEWVNKSTSNDPFFLRSPGFKGIVDCNYAIRYLDSNNDPVEDVIAGAIDETGYTCELLITPKKVLAPEVLYTLHIIGDVDGTNRGISSRTVFDVVPDPGNDSETGSIIASNTSYTGTTSEKIIIEITTSGDIGTAKYKWYYESDGVLSAKAGKVTSRRYRSLSNGVQIRFDGSGFVSGDIFSIEVEPIERMETSTQISFTTNDGSYTEAPTSPSTPAKSEPPASTIPNVTIGNEEFYVTEMTPEISSFNVSTKTRQIIIVFNEDIDEDTVTNDSIKVSVLPVLGVFSDSGKEKILAKKLSVSGNTLTIDF